MVAGLRGRLPVKPPAERFAIDFLHRYLRSPLPAPSYPIDVSAGLTEWQMLGNGPDPTLTVNGGRPVGDCTFAARQHLRMAKAAAAGQTETWETADQLVSEYLAYDHGVDRGANIADVLMYWFLSGKIKAFAPVDHSDPQSCDMVMAAFHGLYVGVDLTDAANDQFDAGQVWSAENGEHPDPSDGHCIVKVKADGRQYDTWVTWGALQQSTRAWTAACIKEAWAVITSEDEASRLDMPSLIADIVAAGQAVPASGGAVVESNLGATAFGLGWEMAQLYGPLPRRSAASPLDHLPSIAEYDTPARLDLWVAEVHSLLDKAGLKALERDRAVEACRTDHPERRREALRRLHFRTLDALQCDDPAQAASYELGRALSDLCWFPDVDHRLKEGTRRVDVLFAQFSRDRLESLQGWLGQMSALAPQTAPIVSRSVQNWANWVDTNAKKLDRDWATNESAVVAALRTQSTAWHQLLSIEATQPGHPPMGAWVHAGEAIVRSTRAILLKALKWFWPVIVVILAATGGLLYLALTDAQGTARVWASVVTVAAGLSAAGVSLRTGATRLAGGLEQTVWQAAQLEARAWAVTWLPTIHPGWWSRHQLRQVGVDLPKGLDRIEQARRTGA